MRRKRNSVTIFLLSWASAVPVEDCSEPRFEDKTEHRRQEDNRFTLNYNENVKTENRDIQLPRTQVKHVETSNVSERFRQLPHVSTVYPRNSSPWK